MMNIKRPAFVIDRVKCLNNISVMAEKASRQNIRFRPHFKTHQSCEIGEWFRQFGVKSITVSSVSMAEYFASKGWKDITVAFPVNYLEINEINALASEIVLNLIITSPETIKFLNESLSRPIGAYIKIDAGYHRAGIAFKHTDEIAKLISLIDSSKYIKFKGFLSHFGNTYNAASISEIKKIYAESLALLKYLKEYFASAADIIEISIGDTPSCSVITEFQGVDEIRPGNFVFYDLMQQKIGACVYDEIAAALACPVVGKNQERGEILIYGGAVHLSKEFIIDESGSQVFGKIVLFAEEGWSAPIDGAFVSSLSQEHGIIKAPDSLMSAINCGDIIGILPVHSCLTASLMKEYITIDGKIIEKMN